MYDDLQLVFQWPKMCAVIIVATVLLMQYTLYCTLSRASQEMNTISAVSMRGMSSTESTEGDWEGREGGQWL